MPKRARGWVASLAKRPVGVPSCSTSPCPAALSPPPCPVLLRPALSRRPAVRRSARIARGMSRFSCTCCAQEKQRHIGVGSLVSSQERRAAVIPRINRSSIAGFVPPSVYIRFNLFVLPERCSGQLFSSPWTARGTVVSWANRQAGIPTRPAPPCSTPPRHVQNSSSYVRLLDLTGSHRYNSQTCLA